MSVISPLDKGNALERAVRAIETVILHSTPSLRENTFKIESKKIVSINGVRHEIDVYVEVDLGSGYKSVFIFECKNWEAAVGKNEIIVFSEKIKAVQAQKGFFVAKSYTRDAEAQAKQDPRVELLTAAEHPAAVPFDFHHVVHEMDKNVTELVMAKRGAVGGWDGDDQGAVVPMDLSSATAIYKGAPIDLKKYISQWIEEVSKEVLRTFPSGSLPDGTHERSAEDERTFEAGELVVNQVEIGKAKIRTKFPLRVVRPPIVSHFEVATRGRTLSFAPVQVGNGTIQLDLILVTPAPRP